MPLVKVSDTFALVDPADVQKVSTRKWYLRKCRNTDYAITCFTLKERATGWPKTMTMQRFITDPGPGIVPDHIDGNGLDNRRENLRVVTRRDNALNTVAHREGLVVSKFPGVSWHNTNGCWRARISIDSKERLLGYFDSEEDAAAAYDKARLEHD